MLRRLSLLAGVVIVCASLVALPPTRASAQGNATPAAANLLTDLPPGISFANPT